MTAIEYVIGPGGALSRLESGPSLLGELFERKSQKLLLPTRTPIVLIDKSYTMASLGVLSIKFPNEAKILMMKSLEEVTQWLVPQ